MTPASNTLYTLMLFLALAVLNLWTERRRRIPSSQTGRQILRLRLREFVSSFQTVENAVAHGGPRQ